jgi:uncharacterized protein YndB with AHSA1/START domain
MTKQKDRVERETFMGATIDRVFAALTDPALYPTWGPERVEGRMVVGERPIFDFGPGGKAAVYIVAIEAPRYFAYRWMQGATDPAVLVGDPLAGPNTLVEFHLDEQPGGTRVRVVESGLDKLPHMAGMSDADVDEALANMGKGWELMLGGLPRHFTFTGGDVVENDIVLAAPRARVHALLLEPARWWFGGPTLEISSADDHQVTYVWDNAHIEFRLEDSERGTRLVQKQTGFTSTFEAKRAHQGWGVILGMLEMAIAA